MADEFCLKWPTNFAWNDRLPRNIQESFTCRKSTTWDRRPYFPSEGRRAEDFFRPEKFHGFGRFFTPRTWVPKASTLPLDHRSRFPTVVYEVLRVVLEIRTVVKSCGCVSNSCVCGFSYVSVEISLPSSVCLPHTSDHFENITLTTVKAAWEWHPWRPETCRRRLCSSVVYIFHWMWGWLYMMSCAWNSYSCLGASWNCFADSFGTLQCSPCRVLDNDFSFKLKRRNLQRLPRIKQKIVSVFCYRLCMKHVKDLHRCDNFGGKRSRGEEFRAHRPYSSKLSHLYSHDMSCIIN